MKALYGDPGQPLIDVALDKSVCTTRAENGRMLVHIVRSLIFLTRQNLALRGKYKTDQEFAEPDSNIIQVRQAQNVTVTLYLPANVPSSYCSFPMAPAYFTYYNQQECACSLP